MNLISPIALMCLARQNSRVCRWQYTYVGKWKNDRRHGRGTMMVHPVLDEERTGGLPNDALYHTFSVDAVWENGVRVR
jgi:hypothetical protein